MQINSHRMMNFLLSFPIYGMHIYRHINKLHFNPLTTRNDQHVTSPSKIHTLSSKQVIRILAVQHSNRLPNQTAVKIPNLPGECLVNSSVLSNHQIEQIPISSFSNTAESFIKIMRITEMIVNLRSFD